MSVITQNALVSHQGIIPLSGDIDLRRLPELTRLEKQLSDRDVVVINVSDVTHVDTTFLRFLRRLKNQPNKRDRSSIKLVGLSHKFRRLMELTGFSKIFEIEWRA